MTDTEQETLGPNEIQPTNPCNQVVCDQFPDLTRMNYCHGQMLSAQDFVDEQNYYLNKIALLTRCLDGYGVVCGLVVDLDEDFNLKVSCGVAIDPRGRELVTRTPYEQSFWNLIEKMPDRGEYDSRCKPPGPFKVHVTIRYRAISPDKEHFPNAWQKYPQSGCCGNPNTDFPNRWQETPCIELTCDEPAPQTCDSCCDPPINKRTGEIETRIWLATLWLYPDEMPRLAKTDELQKQGEFKHQPSWMVWPVDNTIRRHITTYVPTRISGLSWVHGAAYSPLLAKCMLDYGLEVSFSAPLDTASIMRHDKTFSGSKQTYKTNEIVDVWVSDELESSRADIELRQSEIEIVSDRKLRIKVRPPGIASLRRVLVNIRCDFILDKCCRAIDGNHIGGRVPYVGFEHGMADHKDELKQIRELQSKLKTTDACAGWTIVSPPYSGNGNPGGVFQSWFYVSDEPCD